MVQANSSKLANKQPEAFRYANEGFFGLLPATEFRLTTGACQDCATIPQALWFFQHEPIATPLPGKPIAGFSPAKNVYEDIATWHAITPPGSVLEYPPLVWTGADQTVNGGLLSPDGTELHTEKNVFPVILASRHPLNRSYYDDSSTAFFRQRTVHVRCHWTESTLIARTMWPEDFRLPEKPLPRPLAADPESLRSRVREQAADHPTSNFAVEGVATGRFG